jgi:DNA processing protein
VSREDTQAPTLNDEQRLDWLCLIRSEHVGPRTFRALLNRYGSARSALDALPELARRGGAPAPSRIYSRENAKRELAAMKALGLSLIAMGEATYPERLRMIDSAPPLLAVRGNITAMGLPMIAIVGARNASAAGVRFAERLARDLGQAGFITVSGLARGIDAAAHRGSLASGTIAVLAGGHDQIYPPEHATLANAILAQGLLLSEMPLGWQPRAHDFPRRNRLISGLAAGIVVVEAAKRSGSLITARLALEQGREVFAVPGSPLDPRAEGSNHLLKQGATLVTEADDVISVLRPILGHPMELPAEEPQGADARRGEPDSGERSRIVDLLGPTPTAVDDLIRLSGCSAGIVRTGSCSSLSSLAGSSATAQVLSRCSEAILPSPEFRRATKFPVRGVGSDDRADTTRPGTKSTMTMGIRLHGTRELLALWQNWGKLFPPP